ncbi:MAG: hypothetical protein ACREX6_04700 [Casimicrobiaceae bacterium]
MASASCASIAEPPEVTFYQYRYYFAPEVAQPVHSDLSVSASNSSLDATFKSSGNTLSITTYSTDGQVETLPSQQFFRFLSGASGEIVLHLWIAASCLAAQPWSLVPGAVRIDDVTDGKRVAVPLYSFLQYHPGLMRPGNSGVEAEVSPLDRGSSLECSDDHVAAASATFAIDASAKRLVVSLRDVVRDGLDAPVVIPDVDLTFTAATEVRGQANPLEMLLRTLGAFAR